MAEPTMIYKITILELLQRSGFPLSNSQLSDFFLESELTDYFTAQQAISDVETAGLVVSTTNHNNTTYALTEEGRHTLKLFKEKLTPAIIRDIKKYMNAKAISMKAENSHKANYFKADRGGFIVQLKILDDDTPTIDLTLHVASKEQAETICNNWKVRCEDVYMSIMDILVQ